MLGLAYRGRAGLQDIQLARISQELTERFLQSAFSPISMLGVVSRDDGHFRFTTTIGRLSGLPQAATPPSPGAAVDIA
jgi:hypothetical protein